MRTNNKNKTKTLHFTNEKHTPGGFELVEHNSLQNYSEIPCSIQALMTDMTNQALIPQCKLSPTRTLSLPYKNSNKNNKIIIITINNNNKEDF